MEPLAPGGSISYKSSENNMLNIEKKNRNVYLFHLKFKLVLI